MSGVEVTPELLQSATYATWLDQDLLTGDGLIVEIAPDVFTMWENGLEYVKFGKLVGLAEGSEAIMPVIPEQFDLVVEAAEEHPGECVFIESINDTDRSAEELWREFFIKQLRVVHDIANLAIRQSFRANALPVGDWHSEGGQNTIAYASSIISTNPGRGKYGDFDALNYLGTLSDSDEEQRNYLAGQLRKLFALNYQEIRELTNEIDEIFTDPSLQL